MRLIFFLSLRHGPPGTHPRGRGPLGRGRGMISENSQAPARGTTRNGQRRTCSVGTPAGAYIVQLCSGFKCEWRERRQLRFFRGSECQDLQVNPPQTSPKGPVARPPQESRSEPPPTPSNGGQVTDEDDEEAHAFYRTAPPGFKELSLQRGGLVFFLNLLLR